MYGTHQYGYPAPYGPGHRVPAIRTSVAGLGTALTILLGLDVGFAALGTAGLAWRSSLLDGLLDDPGSVDPHSVDLSDTLVRIGDGLLILTMLGTVVVFMCWFWAARNNAEAYAPNRGTMSVGWSIGGWFIPFANWVIPCIVARDVYRGTMAGRRPDRNPDSGGFITGWWWASFVGTYLLMFGVSSANTKTQDAVGPTEYLKAMRSLTDAGLIALPVLAVSAGLAICYVQTVTKTQKQRNAEGDWYDGPGSRAAQGLPPMAQGYGYGYGMPIPGGYPMPPQAQSPYPPESPYPPQGPYPPQYQPRYQPVTQAQGPASAPQQEPVQDAVPPQYAPPAAETQTAEVVDDDPFATPREDLTPPA
ncbi:hypothetical protein GCM10009838_82880 [Catenulispora subtropica]|uniref:DUF4328 domain-containing protein n=1 Tax=Catenulispora subtropica TaxID=450798 RepID=A0ABP5ERI5_9ACTN